MSVTIVRDVRLSGPNFPLEHPREVMKEIGLLAIERITRRTRQGQDWQKAHFAEYSPGYAKRKQQALGSTGRVDLTVSGAMLQDMQIVDVTDTSVTLGFVR